MRPTLLPIRSCEQAVALLVAYRAESVDDEVQAAGYGSLQSNGRGRLWPRFVRPVVVVDRLAILSGGEAIGEGVVPTTVDSADAGVNARRVQNLRAHVRLVLAIAVCVAKQMRYWTAMA